MVCQNCRKAGAALVSGEPDEVIREHHNKCKSVRLNQPTHCDCMHIITPMEQRVPNPG